MTPSCVYPKNVLVSDCGAMLARDVVPDVAVFGKSRKWAELGGNGSEAKSRFSTSEIKGADLLDHEALQRLSLSLGRAVRIESPTDPESFRYRAAPRSTNVVVQAIFEFTTRCPADQTKLALTPCVERLALHEFGHIAGLHHEHVRPEAKSDPNCTETSGLDEKESGSATTFSTLYDRNSVMNYCYRDALNAGKLKADRITLREHDLRALKALYR